MLISLDKWQPQGINSLEDAAMCALKVKGNVLVTAGAGAGKTEFLAQKAAFLLQTGLCLAPQRILAISFKKDAAENLKERVSMRCTPELARRFDSMTFDAFTKRLYEQFYRAVPKGYRAANGYNLIFPSDNHFKEFPTTGSYKKANWQTLKKDLSNKRLPLEADTGAYYFWQQALQAQDKAQLSFTMLNRLAEYLLRENPQILKALRLTYLIVFVDEFQDTTTAQFQLLETAFKNSQCAVTAVGDDKQKIMGWAGAMPNAFSEFENKFKAQRIELLYNWRSHPELVEMQQRVAQFINQDAPLIEAKGTKTISSEVVRFVECETTEEKSASLAESIKKEIAESGLKPDDFALLVRMKADDFEQQLEPAFTAEGLRIRNVARYIGKIDIQELLNQEFTKLILPIFYLLVLQRAPEAWATALSQLSYLQGLFHEDELQLQLLQKELEKFTRQQKQAVKSSILSTTSAQQIIKSIVEFIGEDNIRQASAAYQNDLDYQRVYEGFCLLLEECIEGSTTWLEVLERFEGKDQIPLLTIHKSKGLEYHTVFILGFDSKSWWSLKNADENLEELNALFVAVTRARQRVFFLRSKEKGHKLSRVEQLLK